MRLLSAGAPGVEEWNRRRADKEWERDHPALDLRRVHLEGASLCGANLRHALLSQAHLEGADLAGANLKAANLRRASLVATDLSGADLTEAVLSGANLAHAGLRGSRLVRADLSKADLKRANLRQAELEAAYLSGAYLEEADLGGASLTGAILQDARLDQARLRGANLTDAHLERCSLRGADLEGAEVRRTRLKAADLAGANLAIASLVDADLDNACLDGACLRGARLERSRLHGVSFLNVQLGWTVLADIDLSVVKDLEKAIHNGPSTVGIDTLYRSQGVVPERFLRQVGVPRVFLDYAPLLAKKPIEFYSCFISHSSKDGDFANRLHADLQERNVRCWFAPEDMKIGDEIRPRIDESIRLYDKLLLVLSGNSIKSRWVKKEVETAFEEEERRGVRLLFPIRLDDEVLSATEAWAADIRRMRHIGDFTGWKNHDVYLKALGGLLAALSSSAAIGGCGRRKKV